MANLVQVAEELEYVPKDQLIEYSQNPDSRYPQYLVLSEIQRRTQMERMYNAQEASMNQPTTTVAEEVVADFAQPQGLGGMNVNGSANADAFSPQAGMPAAPMQMPATPMQMPATPMQMAAIGGRTGFQNIGSTSRANLLASFDIDPTGMSPAEIEEALQQVHMTGPPRRTPVTQAELGGASIGATELLPTVPPDYGDQSVIDAVGKGFSSGISAVPQGLSALVDSGTQTPLTTDISTPDVGEITKAPDDITGTTTTLPEIDEKGTIDPADIPEKDRLSLIDWAKENPAEAALIGLDAAALALLFAPVPFARVGAGILKGLSWIGRGLRGLKAKSLQSIGRKTYSKAVDKGLGGKKLITQGSDPAKYRGSGSPVGTRGGSSANLPTPPGFYESWGRTGLKQMHLGQRAGAGIVAGVTTAGIYNYMTDEEKEASQNEDANITKDLKEDAGKLLNSDVGKKGLASFLPQAEGLDIAQLGGIIMGAKNMSELGQGIATLAGSIQDRRTKEKLTDIQGDLYKAQTEKYRADIENMEPAQLVDIMNAVQKMMKIEFDGNNDEIIIGDYRRQYEAAYAKWAELTGTPYLTREEQMKKMLEDQKKAKKTKAP